MSGSQDPCWAQQDARRILVLDVRVQNIEHAQQFYEQHLGMRLLRRLGDLQQGQFTSVCGYGVAHGLLIVLTHLINRHLYSFLLMSMSKQRLSISCAVLVHRAQPKLTSFFAFPLQSGLSHSCISFRAFHLGLSYT